jgi:UDP-sulfoquinovose synthase
MTLAIDNPPKPGEYRTFNQFEEVYDITELARKVQAAANKFGLDVEILPLENPRIEQEEHYYNPDHQHLLDLGYKPTHEMEKELEIMFEDLIPHRERIESRKEAQFPDIRWDGSRRRSKYL